MRNSPNASRCSPGCGGPSGNRAVRSAARRTHSGHGDIPAHRPHHPHHANCCRGAAGRYTVPVRGGPGRLGSFRALSTSPGNLLRIRAVQVPHTKRRPSRCVSSATVARAKCPLPFRQPMRLHSSHHGPACGTKCSPNPRPRSSRRTGAAGSARIISTGLGFAGCGTGRRHGGIGTPLSAPLPGPPPGSRPAIRARSPVIRATAASATCATARSRRAASSIASASASSTNPAWRGGRSAVLVLTAAGRRDPNEPAASRAEGARPAPRFGTHTLAPHVLHFAGYPPWSLRTWFWCPQDEFHTIGGKVDRAICVTA
jgi:hypothetical protein